MDKFNKYLSIAMYVCLGIALVAAVLNFIY
jgi:hypothetical protein